MSYREAAVLVSRARRAWYAELNGPSNHDRLDDLGRELALAELAFSASFAR